jgi:hypothetical protein
MHCASTVLVGGSMIKVNSITIRVMATAIIIGPLINCWPTQHRSPTFALC